ncbi:MAG: hypothetical protein KA712_01495 [Myxococcales bacterium]|nr:hypothetical protein [Myxococcales bacterium]
MGLFCLTDHDTLGGADEVATHLPEVTVLPGLELSTEAHRRTVHLLVYGVKPGPARESLEARLAELRGLRRARIFAICERLTHLGIRLDAQAILDEAGHGTPGRPHVARALVAAGFCTSVREAFERFLNDRGPAHTPSPRLSVEEGLGLATAAGARVALAHPHLLGPPEFVKACCVSWKPLGLSGLEALYGFYGERQRATWAGLAREVGLVATAGSDYHGVSVVPDVANPGVDVTPAEFEALCHWLELPAASLAPS